MASNKGLLRLAIQPSNTLYVEDAQNEREREERVYLLTDRFPLVPSETRTAGRDRIGAPQARAPAPVSF
ncbi:hypothetical protein EVAR_93357_1 [Eumeta japonica]|uniref:Uncharacterized protein n=1 Tax=Eumeta variegata TaxID=151549 RepID=A0A4C1UTL2_EUMVA|nr:hypothetical protein EVAR_93357_1 [Eumeta japonica]